MLINVKKKFRFVFIIFIFCFFIEISFALFFGSAVRFIYPFSKISRDVQTDFDVSYYVERRSGHRIINCKNNNNLKNENITFVGDSAAFGQGLKVEDTFVYLYDCNTDYKIKNLGAIGSDLEEYRKVIQAQDFSNTKLIYLILHENDYNADIKKDLLSRTKAFLRLKSFNYMILRSMKHLIKQKLFPDPKITVEGKANNPANTFNQDPYAFKEWFEEDENKNKKIEEEILKITKHIKKNSNAKLIAMAIPEPSVVSKWHVNFYKSIGSLYLPNFLEVSILAKKIRFLSNKYGFEYLPLYEYIIEEHAEKDAKYFFKTDFHLNKKGSREVYNYLISNKY